MNSNEQVDELNGSGGWNHTNVYAPGGRLVATYDSSTQPSPGYHYNLTDWLGTKRMQTTAGGNSEESCISNPFGDGLNCTGGADATEQHFTGKDHDTESGLDYFYARYYSETLGRFMTPDLLNLTDERVLTPGSTLNKYVYAADNPLKNVDPDGKDVTVFYEAPQITGSFPFVTPGHIMFMAENTQNGQAAVMSFGPTEKDIITGLGGPVGDTKSYGLANMSVSDLRDTYASLTIQTSPEEAQQIIDFIKNFSTSENPYELYKQNCTTVCVEALKIIQKLEGNNKDWRPTQLWDDLWSQYANPDTWGGYYFGPPQSTPGVEYGYQEGGFSPYFLLWILSTAQDAEPSSVYEYSVVNTNNIQQNCGGASAQCSN